MSPAARIALSLSTAALLAALGACAATVEEGAFEPVAAAEYVAPDGTWRIALPDGWKRAEQTLTRDGPEHQTITFNAGDVLPAGALELDPATRPYLLQALQEELAAQPGTRVLALGEATLDGLPGFRMHFVQARPDAAGAAGPEREQLVYAAIEETRLYAFAYEAAPGAAFARDLAAFEALVASFRRVPRGP